MSCAGELMRCDLDKDQEERSQDLYQCLIMLESIRSCCWCSGAHEQSILIDVSHLTVVLSLGLLLFLENRV